MPHPVMICPDSLLHDSKLALPQLLVDRYGVCWNDMLRRHLDRAPGPYLHPNAPLLPQEVLPRPGVLPTTGERPGAQQPAQFASVIPRAILVEECLESTTLWLGHANIVEVILVNILELANIVNLVHQRRFSIGSIRRHSDQRCSPAVCFLTRCNNVVVQLLVKTRTIRGFAVC